MFSQLIPENGTGSVLKRVLRSNGKLYEQIEKDVGSDPAVGAASIITVV